MGQLGGVVEFLEGEHRAPGNVDGRASTEGFVEVEDDEIAAQRLRANDSSELFPRNCRTYAQERLALDRRAEAARNRCRA